MDKEVRKTELYRILKNLYFLAEKEDLDLDKFNKLNNLYKNIMVEVFGYPWKPDTEAFEWDVARKGVMAIFPLKNSYKGKDYEKMKKTQLAKTLEKIEKLKKYLT